MKMSYKRRNHELKFKKAMTDVSKDYSNILEDFSDS